MFLGLLILILGIVFLLQTLGVWTTNIGDIIWPIVLIIFGISMLVKKGCHSSKCNNTCNNKEKKDSSNE